MSDFNDIFNLPSFEEMTVSVPKLQRDENLYIPNLKSAGVDGVYKSVIRFLPNPYNTMKSYITTYSYWLTDINGNNGFTVVDPSSIGEKSPIGDMFWELKNSSDVVKQKLAEKISRKVYYYALIEVLQDKQHPELEGKIKVFRFGRKLHDKIITEAESETEPCNVFDLFTGKNLEFNLQSVGDFPNYDKCRFGSSKPLVINGKPITKDANGKKLVMEFLKDVPDISKYEYVPWTEDIEKKVLANLSTYSGKPTAFGKAVNPIVNQKQETVNTTDGDDTDFGFGFDDDEPISTGSPINDLMDGISF